MSNFDLYNEINCNNEDNIINVLQLLFFFKNVLYN